MENCSDMYRPYGDKLWAGVSFRPEIDFIKIQNEKLIWSNYDGYSRKRENVT